jgi:ribonuclease HI
VTQEQWSIYFDDSFTLNGVGGGVVLISAKGNQLLYIIRLHFCVTNNVAEYETLVNGLRISAELDVQRLYICGDSELVLNQGTDRMSGSLRRSSMVLNFITSFGEIIRQLPPPAVFVQGLFKASI